MAERPEVPVKLYYRIGEVAEIVGVEAHVLRYWESEFKSIRPQKSAKGQRVYSRRDLDKLLRVKELLYQQGYTIAGAKKQLRDGAGESAADPDQAALAKLRAELSTMREQITRELEALDRDSLDSDG